MRFLSILYLLLSVFSSFTEAVDETNGLPNMMEKPANEAHTEKLYWEMMKPADICTMPISYTEKAFDGRIISPPIPKDEWWWLDPFDTSTGALCCALCHNSVDNCVIHQFNATAQKCYLGVNGDDMREHQDTLYRPMCPFGVVRKGIVNTVDGRMKFDWEHYAIGPCFEPNCVVEESCPTYPEELPALFADV